jgi:hypothetical protein
MTPRPTPVRDVRDVPHGQRRLAGGLGTPLSASPGGAYISSLPLSRRRRALLSVRDVPHVPHGRPVCGAAPSGGVR